MPYIINRIFQSGVNRSAIYRKFAEVNLCWIWYIYSFPAVHSVYTYHNDRNLGIAKSSPYLPKEELEESIGISTYCDGIVMAIVITKRYNLLVNMQVMFYMSQAVTSMSIACSAEMHRVTSRIKIKYIIFAWIDIDYINDYILEDDLSEYIVECGHVELNAPSMMSKITRNTDITVISMSKLVTIFKTTKSVCV